MSIGLRRILAVAFIVATLFCSSLTAFAADKITIASVSWTGVTIKSEVAVNVLESLGYQAENKVFSVPIVYSALSTGDADVFFGNWMPSMANVADKFFDKGTVVKYVANMPGAKYTLAVPTYCAEAGLKDFSDIAKYGDKLDWKIYGIEPGNDGNLIIQDMIDKNLFGLGKFKLVASSEVAMLSEAQAFAANDKWIVFLGWAPHSMNERIDMTYLTGSTADTFGDNNGTATVWTNIRKGFDKDNPNVARLFRNMVFPVDMMNQIMTAVYRDKGLKPVQAALAWLKDHPDMYGKWLDGVTTADGKPGAAAFKAYLDSKV
ncbi:ABC transporter substrate-binding protein [Pseudodesulfovibrio indicus]|jgi:glycine betaine/proline transport system substrate-binding protein|uniref:Glycine betaine/proline transport system substrate-binding protein n=1 Tax=Pseudodesulfovibrio indicus TaxID=1716143 RepID=A0A140D912_9BACT|nr:ABC transporter substrate-binding protein [Pseudodesulfovibrio indicus]AMK09679.1 glycine/betaine ABC transporter substrate-binding protein [Pseudodesulfovibrio indicus]TDT86365.1 glycine betaine/proline transport system substrate-binding protein [Pseudodesulfovibrio indicus]